MQRSHKGILIFAIGTIIVPGMDAIGKILTTTVSPVQIAFFRFLLQLPMILLLLAWRKRLPSLLILDAKTHFVFCLRGFFLSIATICFVTALSKMQLADAIAIFLLEPIFLTFLSSMILRERVGWINILIIMVGFSGALVIIGPSFEDFGWYAIMPLISAISFALYLLVTRFLMSTESSFTVHFYTTFSGVIFIAIFWGILQLSSVDYLATITMPNMYECMLMLGLSIVGLLGHLLITLAFRYTSASTLAPLGYIEIASATLLGFVIFGDIPSFLSWVGIFLIIASGLLVYLNEKRIS
jgi:drug/metabolite transporter (DMT)-like permease